MILADTRLVNFATQQAAAQVADIEAQTAALVDQASNGGNVLSAALRLVEAVAAAKGYLTFLVNSVPATATDEERAAVRQWQHAEISRDAATIGLDADVCFDEEIERQYEIWCDGRDEMADALAMHEYA